MTEEELQKYNHISTEEIIRDKVDTMLEIEDFKKEKELLSKNRIENRVRIYFLEGKINIEQALVDILEQILEYRRNIGTETIHT